MKLDARHHAGAFVALIALSGTTFALAHLELGRWGPVVAMGIAATKTLIVAGFFMHLLEEGTTDRLVFATGIVMFCLIVTFATLDVGSR